MQRGRVVFLGVFVLLFFSSSLFAAFFDTTTTTTPHGAYALSVAWSLDGKHLAVGGEYDSNSLIVYGWDGSSLTLTYSEYHGSEVNSVAWSPDGNYLAVGADYGSNDVIVYEWDGSSLVVTYSKHHEDRAYSVAWSPDGNYLAVGGDVDSPGDELDDVVVYSWNGSSLTYVAKQSHGGFARSVAWSLDGNYLAVGGSNVSSDVIVYGWDGATLTDLGAGAKQDHGSFAASVAWSLDGNYLAVGGSNGSSDVIVYGWDGSTLTDLGAGAKKDHGVVYSVSWSPDEKYLAVGGDNNPDDVSVYDWDGLILRQRDGQDHGSQARSVVWSPLTGYLAVGGSNSYDDVIVYKRYGLIDGTQNNVTYGDSFLFNNGGMAIGDVSFGKGFSVGAGQEVTLNINERVGGTIDLNGTGRLILDGDLYFGSHITGGIIAGYGNTLFLERNLTTTPDVRLTVTYDLVIDGQGHDIELARWARLFIESNTTLTLRNLRLTNIINDQNKPPIQFADTTGKLALYNVEIACVDDFYFDKGQLFIHDDVVITGTSRFIYKSENECYIAPSSTLHVEPNVTFFYDTDCINTTTNNRLIVMQGDTSALYLNGCTLQISNTGLRLTKGQLYFDNHVTVSNRTTTPPGLDRGFVWGDSATGASEDLDIFVLSGARVDVQGTVFYDCV